MSPSTMTRMSTNSSSSSSNLSSGGPVLPSFAQTFSDLAGTRSPPENQNTRFFQSDTDLAAPECDPRDHGRDRGRDRDRDRDRDGREQDHSHTEHRSRLPMHEQDSVLPPIFNHQDTYASNNKKRSLDDLRRDDDREGERQQERKRGNRDNQGEGHSPSQPSHIKREPSLSPSPEQYHSHQQQSQSHPNPHYPTPQCSNLSKKRRKNNHDYPLSPPNPSLFNERDNEHSFYETYSHTRRGSAPGLTQSNPSSASSASSSTTTHLASQRPSPPTNRLLAAGNGTSPLSPHQSGNLIHPQNPTRTSSRSPNQTPLQPPNTKSPSKSHLYPISQSSQKAQPQSSLPSSHFSMTLPAPPDSFSTNRKKKLNAQSQGDISIPVPRPINTGSGSATPAMVTARSGSGPESNPGSASGLGLISASASGVNAPGANTNPNIANNVVLANSSTPSLPRGPPRHLTIAPHPHTKRFGLPVIHSAPVDGGFFRGGRDMSTSTVGGVTIRGVGISSVRLQASTNTPLHPPVTPMRIPELPPIPITPSGRKTTSYGSHNNNSVASASQTKDNHNTSHPHTRLPPPHSAGLPIRCDKESAERPSIVGGRLVLDRERLERDRERLLLEFDRGANVPIAKNGGMRSGMVLGSINVPRTPLFSSFGEQPAGNTSTPNTNGRSQQQGRVVPPSLSSSSNSHPTTSAKYLQVPHTGRLNQFLNGNDGVPSPPHAPSNLRQVTSHATELPSSSSNLSGTAVANASLSDPKSSFLTLFSDFYDSLADSKLLKSWLHEQLVKSNTLIEHLEKFANGRANNPTSSSTSNSLSGPASITLTVTQLEDLIERRLGPVKNETEGLRRRVGELEEMVYEARNSGWGRDTETGKKRRRHEEGESLNIPSSTSTTIRPLRTSPPPPLILTPSSSWGATSANSVLRAPASAPLPLENQNRHIYRPSTRGLEEVVNVDVTENANGQITAIGSKARPAVRSLSHSRSYSRTRTRTDTDGPDSTSSLPKRADTSMSISRHSESERIKDVEMNVDVNRSDRDIDEPIAASAVPEHRTSAVRLEG